MTAHLPRLPFSLDPLIAEAKRRMRRRRLLLVVLALVGAGAVTGIVLLARSPGSPSTPPVAAPPAKTPGHAGTTARCTAVSGGFRACTVFALTSAAFHRLGGGEVSRIERRDGSRWTALLRPTRAPYPGHGWWRRVLPDPRGKMLLAQWSGECEVPFTYLITTQTLAIRPVFRSQPVTAVGWTSDGLARVKLWKPVYASRTRIRGLPASTSSSRRGT